MMQTLVINGSPRKNGDTMTLVNEMLKHLSGEAIVIHAYYAGISPCMDCRHCWQHAGCCIDDSMQQVYSLLDEVDNVILASPVYFSELTGQLLGFASRLQTYYAATHMRGDNSFRLKAKNGALVLAAGGDTKDYTRVEKTAAILFRLMNVKSIGTVSTTNTNEVPALQDEAAMKQARDAALQLNQLFESSRTDALHHGQ